MKQNKHLKHLFWLTVATLFISTSGSLGKFIDMPTPVVIWWRSALAAIFLLVFCVYKGISLKILNGKDRRTFFIGAVLMGAHWITYFISLKLSNVAIGMLSIFTFPVIIALLEPLFSKSKLDPIHIVLGLMVLTGIYILAPEFNLESSQLQGVLFGVLSAFCYALRILILKGEVKKYNSTMLMFYQVAIIAILLVPILFFESTVNIKTQYPYVIILALLTTAIGHTMFVNSLKYFKASTASIIGSLQPIFGIIIAFLFLNEIPTLNTFFGGSLILATVIIESIRSKKK
ncbi:EamA family transporter [Winogradskyella sp. PC-19]|uniref:DMT family transporter n=1 Tax=unclassified Winogradskyella TaxID=2615021 RepID=UPI000B3C7859|nr:MULTISPECIES: DMT family transporter [unclassified Winogradskyella]ARV09891.1 EamA family transporter [Winogradskyella sp. PC-19]RZN84426.1 MAG: EamA/RhaT family transporter [Winogradskyella sp.]